MSRTLLPYLFITCFLVASCDKNLEKGPPVSLQTNTDKITFQINDNSPRNWSVDPSIKEDILKVECVKPINNVFFKSDKDSANFRVKMGDTISFYVINKKLDSAYTTIIGTPKNIHFSEDYIAKNEDAFVVDIPETYELMLILISLTEAAQKDDNMIEKRRDYYQKVSNHFGKFKDHQIMDTLNKYISKPYDRHSYSEYYSFSMNSAGFVFDKEEVIDDNIITNMGFSNSENRIFKNLKLINDFSEKSGFREFYKSNYPYYQSLISDFKRLAPIDQMKTWLKEKFKLDYGSYKVIFSPLVGGAHSTQRFSDNGFTQSVMFINAPSNFNKLDPQRLSFSIQRIIFTEIDHNYVNPISDILSDDIQKSFGDRGTWVDSKFSKGYYGHPYSYFNEYMTWAVYSLYLLDKYEENDIQSYLNSYEQFMTKNRGFIKFDQFNQKLIELYKKDKSINMRILFKKMLDWAQDVQLSDQK